MTSVSPGSAINTGTVTLTFTGTDMDRRGAVLRRTGQADIAGTSFRSQSKTKASAVFNIASAAPGPWDVRITIRVIATGRKGAASGTGKYVSIDAMRVENGGVLRTPRLAYQWSRKSHPDASGGRYARADQARAAMRFTFRGTRINWHTLFSRANGKAKVFIDGQLRRTVDTYRAATRLGHYSFRGLSDRVHTIRIVVLGSRNAKSRGTTVTVDRFVVR